MRSPKFVVHRSSIFASISTILGHLNIAINTKFSPWHWRAAFSEKHLRFLRLEGMWKPALIFDNCIQAQSTFECILAQDLEQANLAGTETRTNNLTELVCGLMNALSAWLIRGLGCESFPGRQVAVVFGDVKRFVWEEQVSNFELKGFNLS